MGMVRVGCHSGRAGPGGLARCKQRTPARPQTQHPSPPPTQPRTRIRSSTLSPRPPPLPHVAACLDDLEQLAQHRVVLLLKGLGVLAPEQVAGVHGAPVQAAGHDLLAVLLKVARDLQGTRRRAPAAMTRQRGGSAGQRSAVRGGWWVGCGSCMQKSSLVAGHVTIARTLLGQHAPAAIVQLPTTPLHPLCQPPPPTAWPRTGPGPRARPSA